MNAKPITVSQLNNYIKALLDNTAPLQSLCLKGELSNFKLHSSGHCYFSLKDENAVVNGVMFAGNASKLRFQPESGMKVIVYGRVSLFPKSGQYQIYVSDMTPDGVGALYIAFEQLKEKLYREGIFSKSLKKPLPACPGRIALVTSPTGAAVRDMLRILKKRWPLCQPLVCPVKVQGEGAAQQIADMLDYVDQHRLADLIILGRGGGSIEDLWAFNEEVVARAIHRCQIPIISAVGHEPDITISDYAADLRAATPSNGAELAVPDQDELSLRLRDFSSRLLLAEKRKIQQLSQRLEAVASKKIMQSPGEYVNELRLSLSFSQERMASAAREGLHRRRRAFTGQAAALDALSPLKVLGRGYGFVTKEDAIIKSARDLQAGDRIQVRLSQGQADCLVEEVRRQK